MARADARHSDTFAAYWIVTGFLPYLHRSVALVWFFWHVNCIQPFMARKLNPSKLPRPENGASETLNRRSQPTAATLYLMQLRAHALKIAPSDGIRLEINAEAEAEEDAQPVKIIWIDEEK